MRDMELEGELHWVHIEYIDGLGESPPVTVILCMPNYSPYFIFCILNLYFASQS